MGEMKKPDKDPLDLVRRIENIKGCPDGELLAMVIDGLMLGAVGIRMAGVAVAEAIDRGVDTSDLNLAPGLKAWLEKVGRQQLLPELMFKFLGMSNLLKIATSLPESDQRALAAEGATLKVLLPGGDHRLVAPEYMTADERKQVFAADHVRNEAEQAAWLREQQERIPAEKPTIQPDRYLDRKRKLLVVTVPCTITLSELTFAVSEFTKDNGGSRRPT